MPSTFKLITVNTLGQKSGKNCNEMADSVDPDQTAPIGAV